jgi:UPF0755 protein
MLRIVTQGLKIATIALVAVLIAGGGARAFEYYRDQNNASARIGQPVVITIKKTDDSGDVAGKLHDAKLINSKLYFEMLVRFSGKDIKPASYSLKRGMSTRTIVDLITTEKSVAKTDNKDRSITVIEGWRTEQIAEEFEKQGLNGGAPAFMDAVKNYNNTSEFPFLKDRPNKHSLEGYLFPDTYTFKADEPPNDIIEVMLQNFQAKFDNSLQKRADEMGLSINEVLVFASLVEREAQLNPERPLIAGIYLNRYEQGINLEADPTVQYAVNKSPNWWAPVKADDLFVKSPYNTYQNSGLPPGPICNPGLNSILGVLQPIQSDYIYFVANPSGDGSHLFAVDKGSQDQNVAYAGGTADAPAPCSNPWDVGCPLNNTGGFISEDDVATNLQPSRSG